MLFLIQSLLPSVRYLYTDLDVGFFAISALNSIANPVIYAQLRSKIVSLIRSAWLTLRREHSHGRSNGFLNGSVVKARTSRTSMSNGYLTKAKPSFVGKTPPGALHRDEVDVANLQKSTNAIEEIAAEHVELISTCV